MEQPEISGLIGERHREAGQARNLSVNALAPGDGASSRTSASRGVAVPPLPSVPALARGVRSGVRRLLADRSTPAANRLLETRTDDGVTREIRALHGRPGEAITVSGEHSTATAQLLVTTGRIRAESPDGALELTCGDALSWDGDVEHRFTALDGRPADAVVVVHRPAATYSQRLRI
ncbi:hypothetical protein [Gordonia iterans]